MDKAKRCPYLSDSGRMSKTVHRASRAGNEHSNRTRAHDGDSQTRVRNACQTNIRHVNVKSLGNILHAACKQTLDAAIRMCLVTAYET